MGPASCSITKEANYIFNWHPKMYFSSKRYDRTNFSLTVHQYFLWSIQKYQTSGIRMRSCCLLYGILIFLDLIPYQVVSLVSPWHHVSCFCKAKTAFFTRYNMAVVLRLEVWHVGVVFLLVICSSTELLYIPCLVGNAPQKFKNRKILPEYLL